MNSTLRISTPTSSFAFNVANDGRKDGMCYFTGILGETWNYILDFFREKIPGFRCTIDINSDVGTFNEITGKYTGVLGDLVYDKADIPGVPMHYPVPNSDDVELDYTGVNGEDIIHILSFYNTTDAVNGRVNDILFMFDSIPIGLWIGLLCSFITFISVLRFGHRLLDRRSRSDATWITTCSFLDQDNFPTHRRYILILSCFMSIGVFFAVNYLTNCVHTDLVVIEQPIVIKSYDDIISRNITVVLNRVTPEAGKFLQSPIGSKEFIMGKNTGTFSVSGVDPMIASDGFSQKAVALSRRVILLTGAYLHVTTFSKSLPHLRALVVRDPEGEKYSISKPVRRDIDPIVRFYLLQSNTRLFEAGYFTEEEWDKRSYRIIESVFGMTPSQSRLVDKVVEEAESEFTPVSFDNMHEFTKSYFIMISVALIALIFELLKEKLIEWRDYLIQLVTDEEDWPTEYWAIVKSH